DARDADLRRLLLSFGFVPADAVTDFEAAARIYRRCRQVGVTPRGMVDCMIVAVAYRREATLLDPPLTPKRSLGVCRTNRYVVVV
ncbi:MAG: hypothetical protein WA991_07900, partial [Ornithinimicrobium sp.]